MKLDIAKEVAALEEMTVGQLLDQYAEVFGEPCHSRHRYYLVRLIAWRLQANAEGGLSDRALRRAEELANEADVRVTPPRGAALATGERPAPFGVPGAPIATYPQRAAARRAGHAPPPGQEECGRGSGRRFRVPRRPNSRSSPAPSRLLRGFDRTHPDRRSAERMPEFWSKTRERA